MQYRSAGNFVVGCRFLVAPKYRWQMWQESRLIKNAYKKMNDSNLHLFTGENKSLLCRWDAFFLLNPFLNSLDFIIGLYVDLNLFPS